MKGKKLFNNYQLLLIKGGIASGQDKQVEDVISKVGFQKKLVKNKKQYRLSENIYAGFFEGQDIEVVIRSVENKIHTLCEERLISVLGFTIVDVTETKVKLSMWHDGFY